MKKMISIIFSIIIIFSLTSCKGLYDIKTDITKNVLDNLNFYNSTVQEILKNKNGNDILNSLDSEKKSKLIKLCNVKTISVYDNIIDFECKGVGIAPSGAYIGFYYSADNQPHVSTEQCFFGGNDKSLVKTDSGWHFYDDQDQYHEYTTEKICDNWFFYDVTF